MQRIITDLNERPVSAANTVLLGDHRPRRRRLTKVLSAVLAALLVVLLAGGVSSYLYWNSLKDSPQYSLALLVDAARRDDQRAVDELIAVDSVVDDFMPQIIAKAIEMYGRGVPQETLKRAAVVATPLLPAVKDKARAQLPAVIRKKTESFEYVPFAAMVLGSEEYLDIRVDGNKAQVTSKLPDRPLEVKMNRVGEKWQIVGVRDEQLATAIARAIGQEIIAISAAGSIEKAGERMGVENMQEVLRKAESLFR